MAAFVACTSASDPETDDTPDAGDGDVATDDTGSDGDDAESDADDDAETSTLCEPGELRCLDDSTIQECEDDGSAFEDLETCEDDEICEEGECIDEPVCEPGDQQCADGTSVLTCTQTGNWGPADDCNDGEACYDGECIGGSPTGAICSAADDCAGGLCRCGEDESCDLDHEPYCTSDCDGVSCNAGEICWHSDGVDSAGYHHCLPPCGGSNCGFDQCRSILTEDDDGELVWKDGCLPPEFKDVGEECDSDDECVSESCNDDLFDFGFCTRDCEEGGCPDGTACAGLDGPDGDFYCFESCSDDDDCGRDSWYDCSNVLTSDGSQTQVCTES